MQWDSPLCKTSSAPFKTSLFLLLSRNSTVLNSKVISVTVKPFPRSLLTPLEIEFSHLYNVSLSWEPAPSYSCVCFCIAGICWYKEGGFFFWAPETSLSLQDPSISLNTGFQGTWQPPWYWAGVGVLVLLTAKEALCGWALQTSPALCSLLRHCQCRRRVTVLLAQGIRACLSQIHSVSLGAWSWEKNCALIKKMGYNHYLPWGGKEGGERLFPLILAMFFAVLRFNWRLEYHCCDQCFKRQRCPRGSPAQP